MHSRALVLVCAAKTRCATFPRRSYLFWLRKPRTSIIEQRSGCKSPIKTPSKVFRLQFAFKLLYTKYVIRNTFSRLSLRPRSGILKRAARRAHEGTLGFRIYFSFVNLVYRLSNSAAVIHRSSNSEAVVIRYTKYVVRDT
jgi:hypothetical protein